MNKLKFISLILAAFWLMASCKPSGNQKTDSKKEYSGNEYTELNARLATGWNTWDTRSVLTHVLMPQGFSLQLKLKDDQSGQVLQNALFGRSDYGSRENVTPGPRTYDGSYTELDLKWQGIQMKVQSAASGNDFYLLISPEPSKTPGSLVIHPEMLWNKEGEAVIDRNKINVQAPNGNFSLTVTGNQLISTPDSISVPLNQVIAISTTSKNTDEVKILIDKARQKCISVKSKFGEAADLYDAMQTVLAWNIIYEPTHERVITPISRNWNVGWEGWILFDWDTYFAAYMFSVDNKELAYANAIAITNEITDRGFIPNFGSARNTSEDRSQPPVGSFVVYEIYRKYQEKWFLHEVFDELLSWNRWWADNRDVDGYLCWGSDPYEHGKLPAWLEQGIGTKKGAKWESGMDNSPMYDDAVFDTITHRMLMADVGLMSFYVWDCRNLAEIAAVLGKPEIVQELNARESRYSEKLKTLWNDEFGLYLNKDLVTGEFSYRLSPTLFYPLLTRVPDQKQAERMINEHYFNSREFWGEFIMPAISRNDVAYKDNIYWRGRIWAPLNFLVYLGMRNYELPDARKDLVEKSKNLLLKSWTEERHVYENYSAESGRGDDAGMSDKFYHWGALLGFIDLIEREYVPQPGLK